MIPELKFGFGTNWDRRMHVYYPNGRKPERGIRVEWLEPLDRWTHVKPILRGPKWCMYDHLLGCRACTIRGDRFNAGSTATYTGSNPRWFHKFGSVEKRREYGLPVRSALVHPCPVALKRVREE